MFAMVRLFLVAIVLFACSARTPAPQTFVFDLEDVLDAQQELALDSLFRDHERRTGNEIALVTHPSFHGRSARDFAVSFGDSLRVGKKEVDNGVVIAFSQARREVFIATGNGTER
ncbi:MAG TPA: TPM domain-containing protein, partial [Flavobacteriales bacterium]|nr:TPM domain-containing protein [Flavobacteriales bacterium]